MTSRLSSHLHIPGAEARKERGGCERFEEKFAPLAFASRKYSSGCVVAASRKQFARLTFGRRFWATRALERNTHLCELIVQDFAIMKEQTIRLDPGLNIITGQSGSGKSIFLEVVAQLCGAVAGEELIRFGAESALVHGKFNIGSDKMSAVCNILRHHNVPTDTFSTTSIANHHLPENAVGAKSEPAGLSDQLLVERRLSFVHFNEGDEPPVDSLASSRMMSTPLKRRVRSACRINGTRVPLKALRKLGKVLVDFNGQSAASHLAEEQFQLRIVDELGGTFDLRHRFDELSEHLLAKKHEASNLVSITSNEQEKLESLIHDINLVGPEVDEDKALRTELSRLEGIDATLEDIARLSSVIKGGDKGVDAGVKYSLRVLTSQLTALLANARRVTKSNADLGIKLNNVMDEVQKNDTGLQTNFTEADTSTEQAFLRLEGALSMSREAELLIGDAQTCLLDYANLIRVDQEKRKACVKRLRELEKLCYTIGVQSSTEAQEAAKVAAGVIKDADCVKEKRAKLEKEIAETEALIFATGLELSEARKSTAAAVGRSVTSLITSLGMEGSRLDISIYREKAEMQLNGVLDQTHSVPMCSATGSLVGEKSMCKLQKGGLDRVEFLLATGPNEVLRSIGSIASGGEMCRLLLAIKLSPLTRKSAKEQREHLKMKGIARESSQVGMISVFDELDSGVGGRIGTQIGEALRQLTKSGTQVICVTHLPQVAACGDLHLRVSKQIPFGLKDHASVLQCVEINVDTLNEEARIHEISSMLGLGNGQDSKEMAKCLLEATHSDETK